ncbi:MAG TPA: 5-(carboxyamino)imidazole ribonucleotide synthase [Rhodanobacteraceae bacterium]|nr:5-(carboxyamino)imidazole ribonucleotide synthase [Rhodanobacteraceae bacterium]
MSARAVPTVGILGGGQLARMLALAGVPLGARFLVLDDAPGACAGDVAPVIAAGWQDFDQLASFAEQVDVVTFDFENVPAASVDWLAARVPVFPNARALAVAQDRISEKALFAEIGLPTPAHAAVDDRAGLERAIEAIGTPAILKTRRLGYDGKGQFRLHSTADADAAWAALGEQGAAYGLVLEALVPFRRELSVIAVRGRDGAFRAWPLVQNWHDRGILSMSLAPANVPSAIADTALAHARALAEKLDYVGVFALELFDDGERLLGNEMAPRVHNSGHWSIEGALTSQFENHVRAVLGLPLGDTACDGVSLMFNWIGALPDAGAVLAASDAHWHDYGKSPREGRKVGHATVRAPTLEALLPRARAMATALGREAQLAPVENWLNKASNA